MGSWGYGPFESDQASDFALDLANHLFVGIQADLQKAKEDGAYIRLSLPAIKTVQVLAESIAPIKNYAIMNEHEVRN